MCNHLIGYIVMLTNLTFKISVLQISSFLHQYFFLMAYPKLKSYYTHNINFKDVDVIVYIVTMPKKL